MLHYLFCEGIAATERASQGERERRRGQEALQQHQRTAFTSETNQKSFDYFKVRIDVYLHIFFFTNRKKDGSNEKNQLKGGGGGE